MAKFHFVEWLLVWLLETPTFEFEWDAGNRSKNQTKHGVAIHEVEEVFHSGTALPVGIQIDPPVPEERLALVGSTFSGRVLFVAFVLRNGKIRPISTRPAHRKERKLYESLLRKIAKNV
ncbi:MAG TPA: BrnT family toxin [Bdellovibrionota bacterium]|nr:BrnT family toxin [Bdellovibrionota bacterium]